jgi:biotin synthase
MTDAVQAVRHDWTLEQIKTLFDLPFNDLLFQAQTVHRANFDPNAVQISTLLSIKTGACPEDCSYCPQSAKYDTGLERERLLPLEEVRSAALNARQNGATRFCMGAAWRNPTDKNLDKVIEMVSMVKDLGLESCVTLGMLTREQTRKLKHAGLDYYNHNLDTSPEYYEEIITTRTYQDRLDTLDNLRKTSTSVVAVLSAWARPKRIGRRYYNSWPTCPRTRRACPSICWYRSKIRRFMAPRNSTPSSSCAVLRWRAS